VNHPRIAARAFSTFHLSSSPFSEDILVKIFYINCSGAGFADQIEVPEGTALGQLFAQKMPGCHPGDYTIRLNRGPAASEEVLTEGCRVSITPRKFEGATIP
jgi:hypothetical protein